MRSPLSPLLGRSGRSASQRKKIINSCIDGCLVWLAPPKLRKGLRRLENGMRRSSNTLHGIIRTEASPMTQLCAVLFGNGLSNRSALLPPPPSDATRRRAA